jgi:RimJ/RimL family protein N-acetyltransferase
MQAVIRLRPATLQDAELLLAWRNDPQTRLASHSTHEISLDEHRAWLSRLLQNPARRLFIAELAGEPVGSVRAEKEADGVTELSWTVAASARGQGVGKRMLAALLKEVRGSVRAEVKIGNIASMKMAEAAGLLLVREEQGVLHYLKTVEPEV